MRGVIFILTFYIATACGQQGLEHVSESKLSINERSSSLQINNPATVGPYTVKSYTQNLSNQLYESAIIYYPVDANSTTKFPATTLSGGYTNSKEQIAWLGQHMASHGIISIIFTPTNRMSSDARVWSLGHQGSYATLLQEDQRRSSPIANRIDTNRIGVMGYSMGGTGALLALDQLGDKVRAAVTLCAYQPSAPKTNTPILFITGNRDTIASPRSILAAFESLLTPSAKGFAMFNGLSHLDPIQRGRYHDRIARYATAWNRLFLASDSSYLTYLQGDELDSELNKGLVFAEPSDFIFKQKN